MNKKQIVRLTESDLHKIIKESVREVLKEGDGWSAWKGHQVNNYIRDNIQKTVQTIMQACQKYLQNNDESALSTLYWACSAFGKEYNAAWKWGNQVYGGMNFQQQRKQ
jgi:hypothetical protein